MISIDLRGRFGNHLFQYINGRIVADRLGTDFSLPNTGNRTNSGNENKTFLGNIIFNCDLGVDFQKQQNVFGEGENAFNSDILNVSDNTHLVGFWQSEKYFEGYESQIRNWLTVDDPGSEYTKDNYCLIHFRATGGYLKRNYVLPKEFFDRAKEYVRKNVSDDIKFVIATDNRQMAKEYFPNDIILNNDMKIDFQIMMYCKYKIISNSTFSWWAAWLGLENSELVVAPERWMNYNFNVTKENKFFPQDIKTKGFVYL